jgi:glucose/arabinose dehydrogenase
VKAAAAALALVFLAGLSQADAQIRTQVVASGLPRLVAFVPDPVLPGVFYAVQQSGFVRVVQNGSVLPTPFLDLSNEVSTDGGEQGLLGFAFAPTDPGRVFVNFTNRDGHTVIARFRRTPAAPLQAAVSSRFDLRWPNLEAPGTRQPFIRQPASNHNGGHLAFGPDGYLYIGLGDGGGGNDTFRTAQDPNQLVGKMLRIDVNVSDAHPVGYLVPPDNPFVDGQPIPALPEIWDFGLRNPWRYSFDSPALGGTGALFIGDVGQQAREEISYEPPGTGGRNFGWPMREGEHETGISRPVVLEPLAPPLYDYGRSDGSTVTGGYVYRGAALGPQYYGRYFFADYGAGRVWSFAWQPTEDGATWTDIVEHTAELEGLGPISSFAVDHAGELYLVIYTFGSNGRVLKLVRPPPSAPGTLEARVNGRHVTLTWSPSEGALQYRIEVGSRPGASDLVQYDTGSTATSIGVPAVPDGEYFVRVRALNASGASLPGNEVLVRVGCVASPPPPTGFSADVNGRSVTLTWSAAEDVTAFILEAGSAPSLSNFGMLPLAPSWRSVTGSVPPGTYFARLRAVNACGVSGPSNELTVTVP